jgi:hypothetical protein
MRTTSPSKGERLCLNATIFGIAAATTLAFVSLTWMRPPPRLGWRPISAEARAAVTSCAGPIFNSYDAGGMLIWFVPDVPVFADSRQDPYPLDLLKTTRMAELTGRYEGLFSAYNVKCAVVGTRSPLDRSLASSSSWSPRFRDDQWVIYHLRAEPHARNRIDAIDSIKSK